MPSPLPGSGANSRRLPPEGTQVGIGGLEVFPGSFPLAGLPVQEIGGQIPKPQIQTTNSVHGCLNYGDPFP